jgi:hypothetical protein
MASRTVTHSGKDLYGDITAIGIRGVWQDSKATAISNIERGAGGYHVSWADGQVTPIKVVHGATGKYLRTQRDGSTGNNLENLDDL